MTLNLALVISGDASGARTAAAEARREVEQVGTTAKATNAALAAQAAANDQATAAARRATEALRGEGAAQRELQAAMARQASDSHFRSRQADIEAYGAALDDMRAKHVPLFAAQRTYRANLAELDGALKVGAISQEEHAAAALRAKGAYDLQAMSLGMAGGGTRLAAHEIQNLSFQMNDVAMMLASGQSPFVVMAQQGMQVSQILGNRGLGSVLPALMTGLTSLITPTTLFLAGITAAGYAAGAVFQSMQGEVRAVDDVLADHEDNISRIKDRWGEAAESVKAYAMESRLLDELRLAQTAAELELAVAAGSESALGAVTGMTEYDPRTDRISHTIRQEFQPFEAAINHLRETAAAGAPDIIGFRRMVAERWRLEPANAALRETASALQEMTAETARAALALPSAEKGIDGLLAESEAAGSSLLKLSQGFDSASRSSGALASIKLPDLAGQVDPNVRSLQNMAEGSQAAAREQLQALLSYNGELRNAKAELVDIQEALAGAASGATIGDFFGDVSHIAGATGALEESAATVRKLFDAFREGRASVDTVAQGIDMLRAALIQGGLGEDAVNKWLDTMVSAEMQVDAVTGRVRQLEQAVRGLPDKTITIRTVYETTGGPVGVTRLGGVDPATIALTNPVGSGSRLDPLGGYATFAAGGWTGPGPRDRIAGFVHGDEYVMDAVSTRAIGVENLDAIRRGVKGYEGGGAVGAVSTLGLLSGGRDVLATIEENTFETAETLLRAIGYLETLVDDGQSLLRAVGQMERAIGAIRIPAGSSSGGSGGGSAGGGFSGGTATGSGGGFSSGYSINDPRSPYYYNANLARPGGATYDPIADAFLNGNVGALMNLGADQIGNIYTAQPTNIAGNYQDTSAMLESLRRAAASSGGGTYRSGGGYDITAESGFLGGSGFFGSGSRLAAFGTNINTDGATARTEDILSRARPYGFNTGGMIGAGDTQKVEFFKRPDETVIVVRPEQLKDLRGSTGSLPGRPAAAEAGAGRTVKVDIHNLTIVAPEPVSRRGATEIADRLRDEIRHTIEAP